MFRFAAFTWLIALCATSIADDLQPVDVFPAGMNGVTLYRIPGMVVSKQGTVLAYCEARRNSAADWGEIEVHLRRSVDGGTTWLPPAKIAHEGLRWEGNPAKPKVVSKNKPSIIRWPLWSRHRGASSCSTASTTLAAFRSKATMTDSRGASRSRSRLPSNRSANINPGRSSQQVPVTASRWAVVAWWSRSGWLTVSPELTILRSRNHLQRRWRKDLARR